MLEVLVNKLSGGRELLHAGNHVRANWQQRTQGTYPSLLPCELIKLRCELLNELILRVAQLRRTLVDLLRARRNRRSGVGDHSMVCALDIAFAICCNEFSIGLKGGMRIGKRTQLCPQAFHIVQRVASSLLPTLAARFECITQHLLLRKSELRLLQLGRRARQLALNRAELVARAPELLLARREEAEVLLELVARRLELRLGNLELALGLVVVEPASLELLPRLLRNKGALVSPSGLSVWQRQLCVC